MYLPLTDEQSFLIEAAAGALGRHDTIAAARDALDGAPPPALWKLGAEAGWTGLLSGEEVHGAALSAHDAALLLEACGRRLAEARLLGHLPAVALLESAGADIDLRTSLACGESRAALVDAVVAERSAALAANRVDGQLVISGALKGMLDVDGADVLVVVACDADGSRVAGVCDAASPRVKVLTLGSYDATRSLGDATFDRAVARPLDIDPARIGDGGDLQRMLLAAESVGAADACLWMARDYALERVAFGRQIGSFQAIKHKLVEMLRRVENARSLLIGAGRAWDSERAQFALLANAARVTATAALDYASSQNIFIHGGVGATWEHDAQLYYRRAEISRRLAGGADAPAERVALELLDGQAVSQSGAPATTPTNNGKA